MKIKIIATGKLKERFWVEACDEYLKRLGGYANVDVRELPDINPDHVGGETAAKARESSAIIAALPPHSHVILLAVDGTRRTSEELAQHLDELCLSGDSDLVCIIGGSCGVDQSVYARADETLSFGPATFPHNLARVMLLEQLYRAFKISRGEPYHK